MFYSIFGLRIQSDLEIPGLVPFPAAHKADVQVWLGWQSFPVTLISDWKNFYSSPHIDRNGHATLTVCKGGNDEFYRFSYGDGTQFAVDAAGTAIWAEWPASSSLEDTATYLLGPILGFVLRLRGVICLHASALIVNHEVIALLGPAGAGKSTAAAEFARLGYPVMSDDVVPLHFGSDGVIAQPGYPMLRLWPNAVESLYGAPDALPRLTPNWEKCYLDLNRGYRFQDQPQPLGAIYVLKERSTDSKAPFLDWVSPREGLIELIKNTYNNYALEKSMRAREFEVLGSLIRQIEIRRVVPHADPRYLSKMCELILIDFENSSSARSRAHTELRPE